MWRGAGIDGEENKQQQRRAPQFFAEQRDPARN
jgi:hypothetical protein